MTQSAVREPKGSLVATATAAVRDYISENSLKVGDMLPSEGNFATDVGVSRPVMREAFHALAALKVIDAVHEHTPAVKPQSAFFEALGSAESSPSRSPRPAACPQGPQTLLSVLQ